MKVTPRLPLHSLYTDSGFTEMRYFRLQSDSQVAAVLYAILEEANFPQSKQLRNKLNAARNRAEIGDQRLMKFVLDPLIPQQILLEIWNSRDFFVHLKRTFRDLYAPQSHSNEELLAELQIKLDFKVIDHRAASLFSALSIVLGETQDGVVLLYKHIAMDSIAITPCGHYFTKWALFARAREIMQKPLTQAQFQDIGFVCHCGTDIAEFVFSLGKEAAKPLDNEVAFEVYQDLLQGVGQFTKYYRDARENQCYNCRNRSGISICRQHHKMCMKCIVGTATTRLHFRCVQCQERISSFLLDEVIQQAIHFAYLQAENILVMCEGCRVEAHFREFEESWSSTHSCLLCRDCRRSPGGICPSCGKSLMNETLPSVSDDRRLRMLCGNCRLERTINEFGMYLLNSHGCFVCDFCIGSSSLYRKDRCLMCQQEHAFVDYRNQGKVSKLLYCCHVCSKTKDECQFSFAAQLSHWFKCRVCDSCLLPRLKNGSDICPQCCNRYCNPSDLKLLSDKRETLPVEESKTGQLKYVYLKQCNLCGKTQEPIAFSLHRELKHNCQICNTCYVKYHKTWQSDKKCPLCSETFDSMTELLYLQEMHRLLPEQLEDVLSCGHCKQMRSRAQMEKCYTLTHSCEVCDLCIVQSHGSVYCPKCNGPYIESDLIKLGRKQCKCGNTIKPENSAIHCPNKCLCSICMAKHYLLNDTLQCPKCHLTIRGASITLYCSSCRRPLTAGSSNMLQTVCGVCTNLHVLCCYCVKVDSIRTYCGLCESPVDGKSVNDIKHAQRECEMGCFCGEGRRSDDFTLSCTHRVHLSCIDSIYFCNQCKTKMKKQPTPKTLRDFVE